MITAAQIQRLLTANRRLREQQEVDRNRLRYLDAEKLRLENEIATVQADRTWYGRQLHHNEQVRARLQHDYDALLAAAEAHLRSGGMCPFCWAVRIEAETPHHRADCPLTTTPAAVVE